MGNGVISETKRRISRSEHTRRLTVISLTLVIGIMLIAYGSYRISHQSPNDTIALIILTFGATFTSSAIISFIMLSAGFLDLKENATELASTIGDRLGMPCAERFSLVDSASELGLSNTYINRESSLKKDNFFKILNEETDQIFIVGSSLLGFLQDRHFKHVMELIREKIKSGIEIIFMLTHPLFADFRAAQEAREPKEIGGEILKSINLIKELSTLNADAVKVYLYRGTPTLFGICTTKKMLINPYPYGRQAYESPCFEFESKTPAFNVYKQAHFQTQFGGKIEKLNLQDSLIDQMKALLNDFSQKTKDYESLFKIKEIEKTVIPD